MKAAEPGPHFTIRQNSSTVQVQVLQHCCHIVSNSPLSRIPVLNLKDIFVLDRKKKVPHEFLELLVYPLTKECDYSQWTMVESIIQRSLREVTNAHMW